jgi:hypothetical protein
VFLEHWGSKTASQLVSRFAEARFSFEEFGLTGDDAILEITAYVLEVNGAKAGSQPLTRATRRRNVGKDDEIVITWLEHHANIVPRTRTARACVWLLSMTPGR